MRKIAIIGGTGIYSPETLQCFEEKVIQTPYGAALCNIGTMCGNQVIFITGFFSCDCIFYYFS